MKFNRFLLTLIFLSACAASSVLAQTPAKPAATAPAPSADTNANVPSAKIAVIYSEAFLDTKIGISRYNTLAATLNREFQSRQTELQQMEAKMTALQEELTKATAASVVAAESLRAKQDQLDQMKKDYQRKGEDAQTLYNKRRDELLRPLNDDIGKALEAYAKAHNINVIIDGSQVPFVYAADAIDITRAFIIDFNSKNPATASVAAPR